MKIIKLIFLTTIIINVYACAIDPNISTEIFAGEPEKKAMRTLMLSGEQFKKNNFSEFISWTCRDFSYGGKTLVEVGQVLLRDEYKNSDEYKETDDSTKKELNEFIRVIGFVLYDGTNTGDLVLYERRGLNHRWDWGTEGSTYSFIIKPDGTGLFYDFSTANNGVKDKADGIYKCSK